MSWGAVAVGGTAVALGYLSEKDRAAAERKAADEESEQRGADRALTQKQFELKYGAASESRRAREDQINQEMRERFGGFQESSMESLSPYSQAGSAASNQQSALLGLQGASAQNKAMQGFKESPGQAFLRGRAEKALLRNQAAIGGLGGGNVRTALQEQAVGLAATDYDRHLQRLSGVSGQGLQATQTGIGIGSGPGYIQTGQDIGVVGAGDVAAYDAANAPPPREQNLPAPPRGIQRPRPGDRNDRNNRGDGERNRGGREGQSGVNEGSRMR